MTEEGGRRELDTRWEIVKKHTNLQCVSCSPRADYIFSMKPNPADIALAQPDFERIRKTLRRDIERTKGCVAGLIMKDNHTLAHRPQNIIDWVRIAREELAWLPEGFFGGR